MTLTVSLFSLYSFRRMSEEYRPLLGDENGRGYNDNQFGISSSVINEVSAQEYVETREDAIGSPLEVDEGEAKMEKADLGGRKLADKNVGFLESLCYAFVANYGFAILGVPMIFQQAGWVLTTVVMIVLSFIANLAPLLLTEAQAMIAGNETFDQDVEYIGIVKYYLPKWVFYAFQAIINIYILAVNMAAIRVSSQAVDSFLILAFKHTYGLQFYPHAGGVKIYGPNDWYGSNLVLGIPLGYVILAVLLIPLSFLQLKGNIKVQLVSCGIVAVALGVFVWDFVAGNGRLNLANVPAFPKDISGISQLIGVFIFSLAYASMIPSWVNQKRRDVSPNKVIWITGGVVTLLNYVIPLLAAFAYANLTGDDVFQVMTDSDNSTASKITKAAVYAYTLAVITTSVPVYSITVKNNLYGSGATNWPVAVLVSIVLPWAVSWITNSGAMFAFLLNAAALFCGGFTGFFVPILLYMRAQSRHQATHGKHARPSNIIHVLPNWILPYWKPLCFALLALTVIPTILQIGIDTYYVVVQPPWATPKPPHPHVPGASIPSLAPTTIPISPASPHPSFNPVPSPIASPIHP